MFEKNAKRMTGVVVTTALVVGMMGTSAFAANTEPEHSNGENTETALVVSVSYEDFEEYVAAGVITAEDANQLVQTYAKIEAVYNGLPENADDAAYAKADEEAAKIYAPVKTLEAKMMEADQAQEEAENKAIFADFVARQVLTQQEADKVQAVYAQMNASFLNLSEDATEADMAALDKENDALLSSIADLQQKMDADVEKQMEASMAAFYNDLVEKGVITAEEAAKVRAVHAQVDALYEGAGEHMDEQAHEALDKQAEQLYASIADIENKYATE